MWKPLNISVLLLCTFQAGAATECNPQLKDDLIVTEQSVKVVGQDGDFTIFPDGEVQRENKTLKLSAEARKKAIAYQDELRKTLPSVDRLAHQYLKQFNAAADSIVVSQLGSDSRVRPKLANFAQYIETELDKVLEHTPSGITFHHNAPKEIEKTASIKIEQFVNSIIQDGINEASSRSLTQKGENPLQAMMGGLDELQNATKKELKKQEAEFERFGKEVCQKVDSLEAKKNVLLKLLPQ